MVAQRPIIKEIIVENFMSHVYSRVPLKPGVNIITGPNGAGKSSILLALSVVLGQTYTERSRALKDLIRRGERIGRITIVIDNREVNGKRILPRYRTDEVYLTRYLKSDGNYWYEINNRSVTKAEVLMMLSKLGINPENMLIIMHQGMVERFCYLDPRERLSLFEEALGLEKYRQLVIKAKEKLKHIISEEEAIRSMLERAEETLKYWREKYEKLLRKRELEERKRKLLSEYHWAKCIRKERQISEVSERIFEIQEEIREVNDEIKKISASVESIRKKITLILAEIGQVIQNSEIERDWRETLIETIERYAKTREKVAVERYHLELLSKELRKLEGEKKRHERDLERLLEEACKYSPRIDTERNPDEILDDIKVVNAQLASLSDVPDDAEEMYLKYMEVYEDIKKKAEIVANNRRKALEELAERERIWREKIREILKEVNESYAEILSTMNATGYVRLVNEEDIENAGLEILVGFRGREPIVLDAYTQSGGERTVATVSFLLALQKYIKSPIRGIDEFDVHCDPANREALMRHIVKSLKEVPGQYIVITPGYVFGLGEDVNVIMVQNVSGTSAIRVATK